MNNNNSLCECEKKKKYKPKLYSLTVCLSRLKKCKEKKNYFFNTGEYIILVFVSSI